MSKTGRIAVLLLLLLSAWPAVARSSQPPAAGDTARAAAVRQLLLDADRALQFPAVSVVDNDPIPPSKQKNDFYSWAPYLWPNPNTADGYPYIGKDGQTNPETERKSDKPLLRKMAVAVHTLALAYAHSGDRKYAEKAASFLRTWFLDERTKMNPNLDFGQCTPGVEKGTSTGIIDSRWFVLVIDAIPLLQPAATLNAPEEKSLKNWFGSYLDWLSTSEIGREESQKPNNHGTWYAAQTASYALFTGNTALAKAMVESGRRFIDTQIDSLGRQTFELRRTKSFDYSLYNVHALITLARIGEQVGVDLWQYNTGQGSKKNIRESIRYLAGFGDSTRQWPFPQIAEKAVSLNYEDGDHFSVYYPYDLYSALRIGYKVYRDPDFLEVMNALSPEKTGANRSRLIVAID